jgi:acyl-CoA reductase-like NAD-dependent aldehyde dehydrogenase
MQMIDFSDVAQPSPNCYAHQQTQAAFAQMAMAERDFVAGALSASELPFDRWGEVAMKVRARLCPELYAALTRNTAQTLAAHRLNAPVLRLSLN